MKDILPEKILLYTGSEIEKGMEENEKGEVPAGGGQTGTAKMTLRTLYGSSYNLSWPPVLAGHSTPSLEQTT